MANINSQLSLHSTYGENYMRVEQATQPLIISHQQLEEICQLLDEEFKRGLHRDTNAQASIKMYPTHLVDSMHTHKSEGHFAEPEEGKFLALDLGGTNFRVILVELEKDGQFHMDNEVYSLSQELMHGPGCQLFDYMANCLHNFVRKRNLNTHCLPLGFTFSFPVIQDSLTHARLVNWTKGFKCPDVEGRDVVGLLREAIERRPDLDIEVMAVLNDTTATLISCAFQNRECRMGLIVGTGTNACYMEAVDNVHAMHSTPNSEGDSSLSSSDDDDDHEDDGQEGGALRAIRRAQRFQRRQQKKQHTVINTEWGAFGDNGILDFVRTKWDEEIDMFSLNKGKQRFEKLISGLYIGELCRRVLLDMTFNERVLFNSPPAYLGNKTTDELARREMVLDMGPLRKQFAFETRFVSMVETDDMDKFENTRKALQEAFGIDWASDEDCAIVKLICTRVSTRAAHLVSAAVACLLNRMARPHTVVGVDGSMFKFHPHFRSIMAKKTKELTDPDYRFQLMFSDDGSGKGAAIVASVACKRRRLSAGRV